METEKKHPLPRFITAKQRAQVGEDTQNTRAPEKAALADGKLNIENKEEPVVIPDECGDTLWEAVLAQENL